MEVGRKKRMSPKLLNVMWMFVGILVIGGIYCLSYYNVDEAVVSESKTFFEFVRAVFQ